MEEWEHHTHLSGNHCFEMYFSKFGRTIKFKVIGKNSDGDITAKDCETGDIFIFNLGQTLKKDYQSLREVDCDGC